MVSGSISPSSSECFSPFPHGPGTLSVSREYLALPDGPGRFAQDFSCPALLRVPLPDRSARSDTYNIAALLPRNGRNRCGLGFSPFARHYWGNHCCFLFLQVLRCFSSLRSPHDTCHDDIPSGCRVVPFGYPRITGRLRLPAAFRSLPRPSSPP